MHVTPAAMIPDPAPAVTGVDPADGEVRIVLPASALTEGVVVDADGNPVEHASVKAIDAFGEHQAADFTDRHGRFQLRLEVGAQVDITAQAPPPDQPFYTAADPGTPKGHLRGVSAGASGLRIALEE